MKFCSVLISSKYTYALSEHCLFVVVSEVFVLNRNRKIWMHFAR